MDRTVLIYINKNNKYLFLQRNKKANDLNEGKWIGVGGHIENNESPEEAVIREVKEETNLTLLSSTLKGKVLFINNDYQEEMYVFISSNFEGIIKECNEGTLHWVDKNSIHNLNMWEGDMQFLPYILDEKAPYFEMTLYYENDKFVKSIKTI